jgi:hypothetical protein
MPWAWVQERGRRFSQHTHLLLAVPNELEPLFRPMPLRWTKSVLPHGYLRGVIQTQRLDISDMTLPHAYLASLFGKLHYMLKCAPVELEEELGMTGCGYASWGQICLVIGKRSAVWQGWKVHAASDRSIPDLGWAGPARS